MATVAATVSSPIPVAPVARLAVVGAGPKLEDRRCERCGLQDFWTKPALALVKNRIDAMKSSTPTFEDSEKIVIVGAGGTAAAILDG